MPDKDLYALLGVSKSATPEELKNAFRNKAKVYHPDVHVGDKKIAEEKFKEIGEAYQILSDPQKRSIYDQVGYEGMKGRGGSQQYGGFDDMGDMFGDISDIFGDLFGFGGGTGKRGGGRSRKRTGDDIRFDTSLTLEDIAFGKTENVEVGRKEPCETCKGKGIKPGTSKNTCKTCGGAGKVRQASGFFSVVTTCPTCGGAGETAEHYCDECAGSGVRMKRRTIEVKVPAGVEEGQYIKLSGEGHTGANGGGSGDLYVVVNIKHHEIYKREADDIILEVPVTIMQAVLGDEIEVPTLYGNHKLKIPAGTQNGEKLVIKGKGLTRLHSQSKGDMNIIIHIEIPKGINSKLKDAYKSVKILESEDNYEAVKRASRAFKKYKKEV
ncbi:MAG: molecular chaperone DnaJ [bacterium]